MKQLHVFELPKSSYPILEAFKARPFFCVRCGMTSIGAMPSELGSMKSLKECYLHKNQLSGKSLLRELPGIGSRC